MLLVTEQRGQSKQAWRSAFRCITASAVILIAAPVILFGIHIVESKGIDKDRIRDDFGINALQQHSGTIPALGHLLKNIPDILGRWKDSNSGPEIDLDVKFKHLRELSKQRDSALAAGRLLQGHDAFVPATLHVDGQTVKVEVRLKGDRLDHLDTDRWSLRVKVKGGDQVLGYRRFSLQHAKTRNFQGEVIFGTVLRELGLLVPDYRFVTVRVNGDKWGVMALEEHFSKELLERNRRREGVIVRYNEDLYWETQLTNFQLSMADAFRESKITKSTFLSAQRRIGIGLLRGFAEGHLDADKVFDSTQMGAFLAACVFLNTRHAWAWHNMRFYLNPVTLKLEPIGFDADLVLPARVKITKRIRSPIVSAMLGNSSIRNDYFLALERLIGIVDSGSLVEKIKAAESSALRVINSEFVLVEPAEISNLVQRARQLRTHLNESNKKISVSLDNSSNYELRKKKKGQNGLKLLQAYVVEDSGARYLELINLTPKSVSISSAVRPATDEQGVVKVIALPIANQILPPSRIDQGEIGRLIVPLNSSVVIEKWTVQSYLTDEPAYRSIPIESRPYWPPLKSHLLSPSSPQNLTERYPFLRINEIAKTVSVQPGTWHIDKLIKLPTGFSLNVQPGTNLRFAANAGFLVKGATQFLGTKDQPIRLISMVGVEYWRGISVIEAKTESNWQYVHVSNTSNMAEGDWALTGAITFYKSNVVMSHVEFDGTRGEDALNIIDSGFRIDNSHFRNTASDAFDGDFSHGSIANSSFTNIGHEGGGDGVDFSGSQVDIRNLYFSTINDKAISVGEDSRVNVAGGVFDNVGIGIVSKDHSVVTVIEPKRISSKIADAMVYVKKPEYGPALLRISSSSGSVSEERIVVQHGNNGYLNDRQLEAQALDVDHLYAAQTR